VKLIRGYIPEGKTEVLQQALLAAGHTGLTVWEAKGYGVAPEVFKRHREAHYRIAFRPGLVIELLVDDQAVEGALILLQEILQTGELHNGKLLVLPVEEIVRIRTGERGPDAMA
jgi:nitrogen regulatory protein P-II 1